VIYIAPKSQKRIRAHGIQGGPKNRAFKKTAPFIIAISLSTLNQFSKFLADTLKSETHKPKTFSKTSSHLGFSRHGARFTKYLTIIFGKIYLRIIIRQCSDIFTIIVR